MPESGDSFGYGFASNFLNQAMNTMWMIPQGFLSNWIYQQGYDDRLKSNIAASKELIDYQNDYNNPKAVMQRLAAAGLNPNLVYGNQAPGGTSATGSVGSASGPEHNYTTSDIAAAALSMAQMKQSEAAKNDLDASARLKNAEAANKEMLNGYYPELLEISVSQAQKNLEKTASEIDVNRQSVNYSIAQQKLAEAQTMLTNGEISLQEFRKQQIIAETNLFISEKRLKDAQTDFTRSQDYQTNIETQFMVLELKYKEYFFGDDDQMRDLAESERKSLMNRFKYDAEKSAAVLGIEGSKVAQWTDWIASVLGRILGGAGAMSSGAGSLIGGTGSFVKAVKK